MRYICPTCDGTRKVHSHNPSCYACRDGTVDRETAVRDLHFDMKEARTVAALAGEKFDEEAYLSRRLKPVVQPDYTAQTIEELAS